MKNILVDNKFGHGARFEGAKKHLKKHRERRYVGQDSAPFDWTKPLIRNYAQPIKNQFSASMCGGELLSQFMQIYRVLALGLPFQELSEISIYSKKFVPGGGMFLTDLANCARFEGATAFAEVPTPANCTEQQAESTNWETLALLQDCLAKALVDIQSVHINIDSIAQAIRDNYAVGFLLGGSNNGTWSSEYPQPPVPGSQPEWYHFMCSTPSIPLCAQKEIPVYQSWGISIGKNGIQKFTETFINSGYIYDCFTFTKHVFNKDIQFGMMNDEVKYLQVKLGMPSNTFGFGFFGPKTLSAVKAYQAANKIPATGFVGVLTRAKLNG